MKDSKYTPYAILALLVLGMGIVDRSVETAIVLLVLGYAALLLYRLVSDVKNKIK